MVCRSSLRHAGTRALEASRSSLLATRSWVCGDPRRFKYRLRHGSRNGSRFRGPRDRCSIQRAVEEHQELSAHLVHVPRSPFGSLPGIKLVKRLVLIWTDDARAQPKDAVPDHPKRHDQEEVGRRGEDRAGLADAANGRTNRCRGDASPAHRPTRRASNTGTSSAARTRAKGRELSAPR